MKKIKPLYFRLWVAFSCLWAAAVMYLFLPLTSQGSGTQQLESIESSEASLREISELKKIIFADCTSETTSTVLSVSSGTEVQTIRVCFASNDDLIKFPDEYNRTLATITKKKELTLIAIKVIGLPLVLAALALLFEWVARGAGNGFLFMSDHGKSRSPREALSSTQESTLKPKLEKNGLRGWLLFFCVILTIIFPLYAFGNYGQYMDLGQEIGFNDSPAMIATGSNAVGSLFLGIFAFVIGLSIWRGSKNGKKNAVIFLIAYPLIALAYNSVALLQLGQGNEVGQFRVDLILDTLAKFVFSGVWLVYFLRSKRVRNTYTTSAQ